jgi:hypothetical protein
MQVGSVNVIPQSSNHMIVSLNGTIQKPGGANPSFTVSGSTITFASNLVTGDVIDFIQILGDVLDLGVPSDGTVTTAKLADSSVSLAKLTASGTKSSSTFLRGDNTFAEAGGGIEMADQWRVTAASSTSGQVEIDSNWERVDSRGLGTIGTAMTESSGIFSFPSTGVYVVTINVKSYQGSGDQRYVHAYILSTTDNSSYDRVAESSMWFTSAGDSGSKYGSSTCNVLFDVTNTSTHKIKFRKNSEATITTEGDTDINLTFATFIRLGDT